MKVISVVGARPQFVKLAPIDRALRSAGHEHVIIHTGQHYSPELSDALWADLGIPQPDLNLGVGSGSHAQQTAAVMRAFEPVLIDTKPDLVLVVGDVNSTMACSAPS